MAGALSESRQIAVDHVDRGIRNLQGIITELRPSVLDELGVGPAIDSLARRSSERFGVDINVDVDIGERGRGRAEPPSARSRGDDLQAGAGGDQQRDQAREPAADLGHRQPARPVHRDQRDDDGNGFDPVNAERSFGLVGMQERVSLAGGSLHIESEPGKGTEVRADLPLKRPESGRGRFSRRARRAARSSPSGTTPS